MAKYAERYMYDWLLRNNVEVHEYQPRVLHAKLAVCDGKRLTVGSYNVNNISAYASIELNLEIRNTPFVRNAEQRIQKIMERDCIRITEAELHRKYGLFGRFLQRSAYDIFRIIFFLFTFYFKQRE
jgi:cardiolipin synthase